MDTEKTIEATKLAADAQTLLPKRRNLICRLTGLEVLLRDPGSGAVHFLNPTAATVWECCDGTTSVDSCIRRLQAKFAVPPDTDLLADMRETIASFGAQGLLEDFHAGL